MFIFRQCFDAQSSTYSYLLAHQGEAVFIDPVFEQHARDVALVEQLGVQLCWTIETHVHAGHVTGGSALRKALGSRFAISARSGAEGADLYLEDGATINFGDRHLRMRATPGHTNGCSTFVLDDQTMAFTGDALMIRGCGRNDFQKGCAATLYQSVRDNVFSLPDTCALYPGHDYKGLTVTSVAEEKQHNPRLGEHMSQQAFIDMMDNPGAPVSETHRYRHASQPAVRT